MKDYILIHDEATRAKHGPYPSDELAERLKRLFDADNDEVMSACDELAEQMQAGGDVEALMAYLAVRVDELGPDEVRWGHELKAARETLGLTQQALADMAGVTRPRTVKMWEQRHDLPVPVDVWEIIDGLMERQDAAIDAALDILEAQSEDMGACPRSVRMPYWVSQEDYDKHHYVHDGGTYEMANATSRRVAAVFEGYGIEVKWVSGADNLVPRMQD